MDFSNHLFRCSSWGHLMTDKKEKTNLEKHDSAYAEYVLIGNQIIAKQNENKTHLKMYANLVEKHSKLEKEIADLFLIKDVVELSESAKTHLIDVYVSTKYNRHTDIETWAMKKGTDVEQASITLLSMYHKSMFVSNKEHLSNEYIKGTPDIRIKRDKEIIDIKSSWDAFTFFRNLGSDMKSIYYWQLQGYMWLDDANKARLAYCLVDTPEHLIDHMASSLRRSMPPSVVEEIIETKKQALTFNDIPYRERVIEQHVTRNEDDIAKGIKRVIQARLYLQGIESQVNTQSLNTQLK